jgi:ankyrin repeat protein
MQALTKKKQEEAKMREMLATDETRTIEERVEHARHLHYDESQEIFAVSHSFIHKAAADGSVDGIKHFLNSRRKPRVRIDDFDRSGLCAIHCAAKSGKPQCVKYLVDAGCEPDTRSTYGDTPLMHACKENHLNVVEQLFNYGIDIKLGNKAGASHGLIVS